METVSLEFAIFKRVGHGTIFLGHYSNCKQIYIGQLSQSLSKGLVLHRSGDRLHPGRCVLAKHIISESKHNIDIGLGNIC